MPSTWTISCEKVLWDHEKVTVKRLLPQWTVLGPVSRWFLLGCRTIMTSFPKWLPEMFCVAPVSTPHRLKIPGSTQSILFFVASQDLNVRTIWTSSQVYKEPDWPANCDASIVCLTRSYHVPVLGTKHWVPYLRELLHWKSETTMLSKLPKMDTEISQSSRSFRRELRELSTFLARFSERVPLIKVLSRD